jgi:hypothetical protein
MGARRLLLPDMCKKEGLEFLSRIEEDTPKREAKAALENAIAVRACSNKLCCRCCVAALCLLFSALTRFFSYIVEPH